MTERFMRRLTPGRQAPARKYLPLLRYEFRFRCCYCGSHEEDVREALYFEIDHFRPTRLFPKLRRTYENLYYSCGACNRYKGGVWPSAEDWVAGRRFVDPCSEALLGAHAVLLDGGILRGTTEAGCFTIEHLRLNRRPLIKLRRGRQLRLLRHASVVTRLGRTLSMLKVVEEILSERGDREEVTTKAVLDIRRRLEGARARRLARFSEVRRPLDEA